MNPALILDVLDRNWTDDLPLRRRLLYPAELQARNFPHLISIESFLNYVNDFLGPITISKDRNNTTIGFDTINIHIARSNHEVNVGLRNVDPMS